jgi:hypothetical protein
VFGWCGDRVVERDWADVDVELKISGPLVGCLRKEEEEEDEAGAHEDGEEVEGPLPAQRIAGCYEANYRQLVALTPDRSSEVHTTDWSQKSSSEQTDIGESHAEASFVYMV